MPKKKFSELVEKMLPKSKAQVAARMEEILRATARAEEVSEAPLISCAGASNWHVRVPDISNLLSEST